MQEKPDNVNGLKVTVVLELVHYRFNYLSHGKEYKQRIKLILKGKRYPVKDIHVKALEEDKLSLSQ